tara:strand:- start:10534 stop:10839 length:306 start_codon:yes stop_codon:yes gene_type:complete
MEKISILEKSMFLGVGATWYDVSSTPAKEKTAICELKHVVFYRIWHSPGAGVGYVLELKQLGRKSYEVAFSPGYSCNVELAARVAKAMSDGEIKFRKYNDS